ncbi:cupin domain-containing protein [Arcicella rigui]|uniref:Cupin domain-containing protein n=1 Tax=Arcicella rigui TaxID=797020 RepID=A0ABU5QG80_9BACT|nr:cupin domain-containing protein [Arcicella rigui]MEA5141294.1 cupin domain-containing protein [Arcicella rigui]
MKRKQFLLTTATAIPALLVNNTVNAQKSERPKKGFVVKASESRFGEKTLVGGKSPNNIKVSQKDTDSDLTVFEYIGNEKGGPPLHVHPNQDEIFFIVEGTYLFQVGEDKHTLTTGDTIFLPRTIPHTFAQLSEKGKMFFLFQPSGKMEDFFRVLGSLTAPPTPEQGAKIFADHDMKVVGPPLSF